MRPTLSPGEEIVATDSRVPEVGQLVVFPHPGHDDFWLVKRRAAPPMPLSHDLAWAVSDHDHGVDSSRFGPVSLASMWTVIDRLDDQAFTEACALLASEETALATVIETHGMPLFWSRPPGFPTMVLLVLEQQVSLESGAAVFRRLEEATGGVTPETILALGEGGVRACGVTRQKTGYILGLAELVAAGELDLELLMDSGHDQARATLLALRGVGHWTADVYLLSALRHPDVFPLGDRALQVGMAETLGLDEVPDDDELTILAEPWRPLRAAAARLIWHAYLSRRGRVEPEHET